MSSDRTPASGQVNRRWILRLVVILFVFGFVAYAVILLRHQTDLSLMSSGPLQVRTDLMRGQPCHVGNGAIMGDCTRQQIEMLQEAARLAGKTQIPVE